MGACRPVMLRLLGHWGWVFPVPQVSSPGSAEGPPVENRAPTQVSGGFLFPSCFWDREGRAPDHHCEDGWGSCWYDPLLRAPLCGAELPRPSALSPARRPPAARALPPARAPRGPSAPASAAPRICPPVSPT